MQLSTQQEITQQEIRILHVDDDPSITDLSGVFLEREDGRFTVETAKSADEGLQHISDRPPDCVVSDYNMPGMDGLEFLQAVREKYPDLPFILFTGKGSEEIASDAISAGVTDYLRKRTGQEQYELLATRIRTSVGQYRAEQKLERQNDLFNKAQDLADVGAWEWNPQDETAHYTEQVYEIYGIDPDHDGSPEQDIQRFYHPDDRDTVREAIQGAVQSGDHYDIEVRIIAADGTEKWVRTRGDPQFEDGTCRRVRGTIRDITERKVRERDVKQQQQRLTVALEGSNAGVWEWEPETDEVVWHESTERLFGLEPGTFEGTYEAFAKRVHNGDLQILEAAIEDAFPSREPFEAEYRIQTDDDRILWIRARGEFADIEGLSPRYIGVITDITERKEHEQDLKQTTEWYQTLLDAAPDAAFVAEAETGEIRETNQAATRLLDRPRDEIVGMHQTDLHPPEKVEEYAKLFEEHVTAGGGRDETLGEQVDIYVLDADGKEIPVEINAQTVEIDGEYLNQGYFRDITDRKKRERELQRQNSRLKQYETLVKTVGDPMYMLDDEGNITMVNEAVVEQWGYERDELLSMHASDVMPDKDYKRGTNLISELLENDERSYGSLEMRSITADGEILHNENKISVITDDGEYVGTVGVIRDITKRKQRERELDRQREQLEQRQEKLLQLRDYTQELMYAETDKEIATIALRAVDEILGFELGAVFTHSETRKEVLELIEASNRSRMTKMYGGLPAFVRDAPSGTHSALAWEVFETGESVFLNDTAESERLTRKSPFGSLMIYPISGHGIVLLAATQMEAFSETEEILLDLLATTLETAFDRLEGKQDLRRQRDELERQNERLEEFASIVAHDLRNPLQVADSRLELIREECNSDHIDPAAQALDRTDALIGDLRTLAREGKRVGETESVELANVAKNSWQMVNTEQATLEIATTQAIPVDRSRLQQLFENLYRNAVEHGGDDVTVSVGAVDDGFYVADTGPGIPESDREEVFKAGYSTTEDGTGFGLRIIKQIAEAHGWKSTVTESEQGGARFEFTGGERVD